MDHIGIDVDKREGQIGVLAEGGEVIGQRAPDVEKGAGLRPRAGRGVAKGAR
jgi:hypothetical protein